MSGFITSITTGIVAFMATNIDDILILMVFFSQANRLFRRRHIVLGQYLGFSMLVLLSLPGFLGSYWVSPSWIRLLGLVPVILGLNLLLKRDEAETEEEPDLELSQPSAIASFIAPQTYTVAAVTVANGSDNIGIYVPLFANSQLEGLLVIVGVFFLLVGVWCLVAYKLAHLSRIAHLLTDYGKSFVPCVLIALGVFIVKQSLILMVLALGMSSLYLVAQGKLNRLTVDG